VKPLKMLVIMMVALISFYVAEGRTSDGGLSIVHNKVKEKNVLRCWAVTQSGNRCKRRAVSGCRYCKQHSAERTLKRDFPRCRSMSTNDVQCSSAPLPSKSYCQEHLK
jgi:hypothetical protein